MQSMGIKSHHIIDMTMAFRAVKALKTYMENRPSTSGEKKKIGSVSHIPYPCRSDAQLCS